ncbi:MAG: 4-hydroxy-3-methylbut-2-enyl diphosphate reductase [Ignavibacteriales bacterium]|nr:4-hydroxy-3-methylbut-2-enyl diphosphate reductase [Ignavibacteriales bacterium]
MKLSKILSSYRSEFIAKIKKNTNNNTNKKDFNPIRLDFGSVVFLLARYFGFCYGVENAIEIAYRTVTENPTKRIFLLSEMIHNPLVNQELLKKNVQFIFDSDGQQKISWNELTSGDIIIIPAFGTSIEIEKKIIEKGIDIQRYNTTCPFVQKVWKRGVSLGDDNFTVMIHGKHQHEETKATFSRIKNNTPSFVVRDINEVKIISRIILGKLGKDEFYKIFEGKYSEGFDVNTDLDRIGVVNQTTMLSSETQAIANELKNAMIEKYGIENLHEHFADTRDTLCYATNNNQKATEALLTQNADIAIVVGGYNSSNTTHLVEMLEEKFITYFIDSAEKILSKDQIKHFDIHQKIEKVTNNFVLLDSKPTIILTSGASCPDSEVENVISKILSFLPFKKEFDDVLTDFV